MTFPDELKAMNADSSETKRLVDAVASVAATMAERFNEKLKAAAADSGVAAFSDRDPTAQSTEYPNRYTPIPPMASDASSRA